MTQPKSLLDNWWNKITKQLLFASVAAISCPVCQACDGGPEKKLPKEYITRLYLFHQIQTHTRLMSSRNSRWVREAATSCCSFCHNWSLLKIIKSETPTTIRWNEEWGQWDITWKGLTLEQALGSRGYRSLLIGWFLLRISDFSLVGNITDHCRISYQTKHWNRGLSVNYDLVLISLN